VSTPRTLELPDGARRVTIQTSRGAFAALEALPTAGVCERAPALLVPGFTGSKEDFLSVIGLLAAAGRRVVAIDMRGQYETPGGSDEAAYSLSALAADVALIADELIADELVARDGSPDSPRHQIHLMGHSFGGLVAREVVLARAARTASLTLMSSGPGALTGPRADVLRQVHAALEAVPAAELAGLVKHVWETELAPGAIADGAAPDVVTFLRTRMLANCPLSLRVMAKTLLTCPDRTKGLREAMTAPLLVLYGEQDDAWAPAIQERMAERLSAQRVCIPGAAHSPPVEAPETTASTLTKFWNAAESKSTER
jgi:pimeloyl-ACP methyl ester carboxylesterase